MPRIALFLALLLLSSWVAALQKEIGASDLERHPMEILALTEPDRVLAELPAAIDKASRAHDLREVALLYLAKANACRVTADWLCQRSAGGSAREAAILASAPMLEIRGLIADSRASIAMQDFLRGERLLGEAEGLLRKHPEPELSADIFLAYSSMSYQLNRYDASANYAKRGLETIPADQGLATRVRLLRNLGRAQASLEKVDDAERTLQQALILAHQVDDPKLTAELYLESARLGHIMSKPDVQSESAEQVLQLAQQLKNSQLEGQALEALGFAAADAKDEATAEQHLRAALASFQRLGLERDESRVLRNLIALLGDNKKPAADLLLLSRRMVELSNKIDREDRAKAADDFESRLRFINSENEIRQLKLQAEASKERERLLLRNTQLAQVAAVLVVLVLMVLSGLFLQVRRNKRLQERMAREDALTGIANRRQFDERLGTALARSKRTQSPLILLALDIDKFKAINDGHGHAVGDAVIIEFARRITACAREGDLVARMGGDEFLILIEDAKDAAAGAKVAEKILARMEQPMQLGAHMLEVRTSIGVAFMTQASTAAALLDLADRALYAAKEAGRNTVKLLGE